MMSKASNDAPARVPAAEPRVRRRRLRRVAVEPARDVVGVELLAPEHPGQGLPEHERLVGASSRPASARRRTRRPRSRRSAARLRRSPPRGCRGRPGRPQANAHRRRLAGLDLEPVPEGGLRARLGGDRRRARDDVVVDPVLRRRWSSRPCRTAARRSSRCRRRARGGSPCATSSSVPRNGCSVTMRAARPRAAAPAWSHRRRPRPRCCGTRRSGSTWIVSASGPAFVTRIVSSRSCGSAFA